MFRCCTARISPEDQSDSDSYSEPAPEAPLSALPIEAPEHPNVLPPQANAESIEDFTLQAYISTIKLPTGPEIEISPGITGVLIGEGGNSKVYASSGIAIKTCRRLDGDCFHPVRNREITTLETLSHSNIISYLGLVDKDSPDEHYSLDYKIQLGLSDLRRFFTKTQHKISIPDIWKILHDVSQGLEYLDYMDLVHRDIKPDNLILCLEADGTLIIKISDFDLIIPRGVYPWSAAGTPHYMPPESYTSETKLLITPAFDVFSLGLILYKMLTGLGLYSERVAGFNKIKSSLDGIPLLKKWSEKPKATYKITELSSSRFDSDNPHEQTRLLELYHRMTEKAPSNRISAARVRQIVGKELHNREYMNSGLKKLGLFADTSLNGSGGASAAHELSLSSMSST